MRCLVTGATGHLGVPLVRLLVENGCEVAVLVRPSSDLTRWGEAGSKVQTITGDLSDVAASAKAISDFAAQTVFHLGWHGVANAQWNDLKQIDHNLQGSVHLARLCIDAGCRCWIGLGSQAEYGRVAGALHEDLPTRPETLYATTKVCTQLLTQNLCKTNDVRFAWLRLMATYGPWDAANHLIAFVIRELLQGRKPSLTKGEQRWDYLFVDDAAQALWQMANSPANGIFNLGSGKAQSLRDIVTTVRDLIDPDLPLGWGEVPYSPNQVMNLHSNITRLVQATGWKPTTPFQDGLQRTIAWQKEQLGVA